MSYTDPTMTALEGVKKTAKLGGEYWMARDIQVILGYTTWENFSSGAIKRAIDSCRSGGIEPSNHFRETTKMVEIGSGAKTTVGDYYLDRYACYLVAMNGEATKPEISAAQRYFAVQTRLQEIDQKALEDGERVRLRGKLKDATKHLHSTAKKAGVQNYAFFNHAGYLGLYEMGLSEIKKRKGIPEKEDLFDHAGRLELSANEFRATLAEESIRQKKLSGQDAASNEHRRVGKVVRDTLHREANVRPENLPSEPSIKKLESAAKKKLKGGSN